VPGHEDINLLELLKQMTKGDFNVYYTYLYTKRNEESTNVVYQDLSYPRFRTIQLSIDRLSESHREQIQSQINTIISLTKTMQEWLDNNRSNIQYETFRIPKATGGFREINAPCDVLKSFMREVKLELEQIGVLPHDSAYAYIANRDCKKAIERHQSRKANWFLKMDIEKFFNNCSPGFIRNQLRKLAPFSMMREIDYNHFVFTLNVLSCYKGELPQGTPLSPLLTNWLMIPIDHAINKALNEKYEQAFTYTRYADDLLISSKYEFNQTEIVDLV
jgi:hypothetical protein